MRLYPASSLKEFRLHTLGLQNNSMVGYLKSPRPLSGYLEMLKKSLKTSGLRYYDAGREVWKIGVVCGSGGDNFDHAVKHDCDTFVTADIKYDVFLEAKELDVNLIDGDHFCTENVITAVLAENKALLEEAQALVSAVKSWLDKNYPENEKPSMQTPDPALLKSLEECCEQYSMNGVNDIMDELESYSYDRDDGLIAWLRGKADISDFASMAVRIKELSGTVPL